MVARRNASLATFDKDVMSVVVVVVWSPRIVCAFKAIMFFSSQKEEVFFVNI